MTSEGSQVKAPLISEFLTQLKDQQVCLFRVCRVYLQLVCSLGSVCSLGPKFQECPPGFIPSGGSLSQFILKFRPCFIFQKISLSLVIFVFNRALLGTSSFRQEAIQNLNDSLLYEPPIRIEGKIELNFQPFFFIFSSFFISFIKNHSFLQFNIPPFLPLY